MYTECTHRFVLALVAGLGLLPTSCGPDLTVSGRAVAIANGDATEGFPSVGKLIASFPEGEALCSATLVGRKTVLTSAHCVNGAVAATVWFGDASYTPRLGATDDRADLAVLGLEEAPDIDPTPIATLPPKVGTKVRLVGFGVTHPAKNDEGIKRTARNRVSELQEDSIVYHGAGGSRGNACFGDSGGPTFARIYGRDVQIGVHESVDEEVCAFGAFDVRLDLAIGWLALASGGDLETVDAAPGDTCAPPPAGTNLAGVYASESDRLDEECVSGCSVAHGPANSPLSFALVLLLLVGWRRPSRRARLPSLTSALTSPRGRSAAGIDLRGRPYGAGVCSDSVS